MGATFSLVAAFFGLSMSSLLSEFNARAATGTFGGLLICDEEEEDSDGEKEARLDGGDGCSVDDGRDLGGSAAGGVG